MLLTLATRRSGYKHVNWMKITLNGNSSAAPFAHHTLSFASFISHICIKIRILFVLFRGPEWILMVYFNRNGYEFQLRCNAKPCHVLHIGAYCTLDDLMHWLWISGRIEMQLFNSFGFHCTFAAWMKLHCRIRNNCCTPGGQHYHLRISHPLIMA